jgi:ribosome recycling factor
MHKVIQDAESRMQKSIDAFKQEISRLRTGRAHPSLLDQIRVDYYGNETPISQVANVSVSDARTLVITPWEKKMIPIIEKAIRISNLGLNPATSGDLIRVPLPPLTEERRKELIKILKNEAEGARVGIRNVRRDANNALKESLKKKEMAEDEEKRLTDAVQKLTDKRVAEVDQLLSAKESDLMAI